MLHFDKKNLLIDLKEKIGQELKSKGIDYVIKGHYSDLYNQTIKKYTLEPLKIVLKTEYTKEHPPTKISNEAIHAYTKLFNKVLLGSEVFCYQTTYNYKGPFDLFKQYGLVKDSSRDSDFDLNTNEKKVTFVFYTLFKEKDHYLATKKSTFDKHFKKIESINESIILINEKLPALVDSVFNEIKDRYTMEKQFNDEVGINSPFYK